MWRWGMAFRQRQRDIAGVQIPHHTNQRFLQRVFILRDLHTYVEQWGFVRSDHEYLSENQFHRSHHRTN